MFAAFGLSTLYAGTLAVVDASGASSTIAPGLNTLFRPTFLAVATLAKSVEPQKSISTTSQFPTPRSNAAATTTIAPPKYLEDLASRPWTDYEQRQLDKALASRDPSRWKPMLGQLLNQHYRRDAAIAALVPLLDYPDVEVKRMAASELLELGSYAGVPMLQALLHVAATGELSAEFAEYSADTLHRYRQTIDPNDLYQAYTRFKTPGLIEVATMQQVPEMRDVVLKWRANKQGDYDMDWMAAYLGMKDPEAIERYQGLLVANDPRAQLLAHWALYRALGRQVDLDFLVFTARQFAGIEPLAEANQFVAGARTRVFDLLAITIEPQVTKALEEIVDHVAKSPTGNSVDFMAAFGALFYLHKDFTFVDRRVLEFLNGQYPGQGVDRTLMFNLAAYRRTPEIDAAARAFNALAYDYALTRVEGRPIESWWGNLAHVPLSVAPPLPAEAGKK